MKMSKLLSIVTLVLLASQLICGFYIVNNPVAAASGSIDFHKVLGIVTFFFATVAIGYVFRKIRKAV